LPAIAFLFQDPPESLYRPVWLTLADWFYPAKRLPRCLSLFASTRSAHIAHCSSNPQFFSDRRLLFLLLALSALVFAPPGAVFFVGAVLGGFIGPVESLPMKFSKISASCSHLPLDLPARRLSPSNQASSVSRSPL
jgi:hypothetical protein